MDPKITDTSWRLTDRPASLRLVFTMLLLCVLGTWRACAVWMIKREAPLIPASLFPECLERGEGCGNNTFTESCSDTQGGNPLCYENINIIVGDYWMLVNNNKHFLFICRKTHMLPHMHKETRACSCTHKCPQNNIQRVQMQKKLIFRNMQEN